MDVQMWLHENFKKQINIQTLFMRNIFFSVASGDELKY